MLVLVINCGSSSIKYKVLDTTTKTALSGGLIERVGAEKTHHQALQEVLDATEEFEIGAVGHRVVHGGAAFCDPALIDGDVIDAIEACVPLAPLHNPVNLAGIRAAQEALPDVPHVAVFDTAFHHSLPKRARHYALDFDLAEKHGVRRYGFHGTSHAFVAREAAAYLKTPLAQLRIITCHLGNGASICAVETGHSVETSMGMTPLEGLVMGTRSGDVDPGAILALLRQDGMSLDELDRSLNKKSGLLGLSGHSNDLRDLEERAANGDDRARLAIGVFAHRVRKYIGAYAATMGGVDAIVMTGGIGENSVTMRRRILQRFEYLGLILSEPNNVDAAVSQTSRVAEITESHSRVRGLVVATDEALQIAQETARVVEGVANFKQPAPLPIAISARHAHLTAETFHRLFGDDTEMTERNPLSQPGQFAAEQTVGLVGPRRRLERVRVLGPYRSKDQVEISRTDEFFLGVDAPVRGSGQVEGSAPITLEGPNGSVFLSEGLICARRHIHMTPEDADAYGVEDRDEVAVRVSGGPRDLTFEDVLVRVSSKYKLEMHLDTDEANAAELSTDAVGDLVAVEDAKGALIRRRPSE